MEKTMRNKSEKARIFQIKELSPGFSFCLFSVWLHPTMGSAGKESPAMRETWVWSLSWEDPPEKGKATYSSILVWEFHGLYSLWSCKESDTTERLSLHFTWHQTMKYLVHISVVSFTHKIHMQALHVRKITREPHLKFYLETVHLNVL